MNILFISKEKPAFDDKLSPIVKNQGDSLIKLGHNVTYYIVEKGLWGYLKLLMTLKKYIKSHSFDLIHSHYSITSIFASLAIFPRRIIVSLMGSDTETRGIILIITRLFATFLWRAVIVKTEKMKNMLKIKKAFVLPNGVDFDKFRVINKTDAQSRVCFSSKEKNILFLADPSRKEKNVNLARKAIILLNDKSVKLHEIYHIPNNLVPYYLNASDLIVLSSFYEGSVNIIKEALACCIPIVSTDVGDVKENIKDTEGCYISTFSYQDFSHKIEKALMFNNRTNGRKNINHLRDEFIARKLLKIYQSNIRRV